MTKIHSGICNSETTHVNKFLSTSIITAFLLISGFSFNAFGSSLTANTIICDSKKDMSILKEKGMVGQSPQVIMSRVDDSIGLYKNLNKLDSLKSNLASREEENRNNAYLGGSSGGEISKDNEAISSNSEKLRRFIRFRNDCTINNVNQQVKIIRTKPIQGIIEVEANVNGSVGNVWATTSSVTR